MADTPTARTLKALRDDGYLAGVVEYWQPSHAARSVVDAAKAGKGLAAALEKLNKFGPGKRQDLFGFVDVVAVGGPRPLFVQCTAYSGISARVTKIVTECNEEALLCLKTCDLQVWGWKKFKKAVDRKYWRPSVRVLTLASNGGISVEIDKTRCTPDENRLAQTPLPF